MGEDKFFALKVVQAVLIIIFFGILFFVFYQIRDILMLSFLSIILSLFIRSIADTFQRRFKFKRWIALLIGILSLILLLAIPFATVSVPFISQVQTFLKNMPEFISKMKDYLIQLNKRFPFIPNDLNVEMLITRFTSNTESLLTSSISYIGVFTSSIVNFILMIALAAFFASNPGEYNEVILRFVPSAKRHTVLETIHEIESILKHWIVGTLLAIFFVGGFATLGFSIIGLQYFLVFGIAAGFLEIIPYFGPTLGILAPVLYALILAPSKVIPILIIYLIIQFVENYFFIPYVMRKQVDLPPAISILAILVFGKLLGFLGIVVGLPLFATILLVLEKILSQQSGKLPRKRNVESDILE